MKISKLTQKELNLLSLINKDRIDNKKSPIQWDKMPRQEVLTHLYGWDNPNVDIEKLLTPKESKILKKMGYSIGNHLKGNTSLLQGVRRLRKNP